MEAKFPRVGTAVSGFTQTTIPSVVYRCLAFPALELLLAAVKTTLSKIIFLVEMITVSVFGDQKLLII